LIFKTGTNSVILNKKVMLTIDRITSDPNIMAGKACIRGMRITVSLILNLIANGMDKNEILEEYPNLQAEDINQCLQYAAYLAEEELYITQKVS
jgi:uncharacterized protein (DUF433 family)